MGGINMSDQLLPQMRDELEEDVMASVHHKQRQTALFNRERAMKERLRLDVMKRNKNRKRNKLARKARANQRCR